MKNKYGLTSLKRDFPTDDTCLDFIFETLHSRECSCGGTYKRITGRKQYQCSKCRFQIAPTAGTIFHKSDTPLTLWFHALLVFSNAKSGISAKYLQRELEVTYKCAYRILKLIRTALLQGKDKLDGTVEMDVAYFGGKGIGGKDNKNLSAVMKAKSAVIGAVSRGGEVRFKVVPDASAVTLHAFLEQHVQKGARLMTDGALTYTHSAKLYNREYVDHKREYARGDVHINNIETLWGHIKRSVRGVQKSISKTELQSYLDGFAFHYNNRHSDSARFGALLGSVLRGAR